MNDFEGSDMNGKRKTARLLNPQLGIHLVLKLNEGLPLFFNPRNKTLREGFIKVAHKFGITVYQLVLNGTHVHVYLKIKSRKDYVRFIRALTSKLVAYFSRILRKKLSKIFNGRPFIRMTTWGREVQYILKYLKKNERESGVKQIVAMPTKKKIKTKRKE